MNRCLKCGDELGFGNLPKNVLLCDACERVRGLKRVKILDKIKTAKKFIEREITQQRSKEI